jgi:peptide-methionine (S)-S-oxide reductase
MGTTTSTKQIAIFGGGCFWCTEAIFEELRGVISVMSGYTGGTVKNPTYEQVCAGATGHAEAAKIEFDPAQISYHDLLTVFFATHNPTTRNRQGNDVGTQYRSSIFYTSEEQKTEALAFIKRLEAADRGGNPIVTEVAPFDVFYEAEDYHRQYYKRNGDMPYCQVIIEPKVEHLQREFAALLKEKSK